MIATMTPGAGTTVEQDLARAVASLAEKLPRQLRHLASLAYNYWWSWTPGGPELFSSLDPVRWRRCGENPVRLLQELPASRLAELAADATFVAEVNAMASRLNSYLTRPALATDGAQLTPTVHMCAEFGLHESMPTYAGGLGVLMGDFLKELI